MPTVDFSLYLITDRHQTAGRPFVPLLEEAMAAGVKAVQLREKDLPTRALLELAGELLSLTRKYHGLLFVNDRIDVVLAVGADGVHLRSDSLPVRIARQLLGPTRWIGVSAHTVEEVLQAQTNGADFVVLGPVYETPSKRPFGDPIGLRPLEEAGRRSTIPIFAIGGITAERVSEVRGHGASGVAVVSAILASENIDRATRRLLRVLPDGSTR